MGKTRLTAELAAGPLPRGFTVLSGRCAELGDAVPYLPLADALRNAATGPSASRPLLDALAARPVLSRLLPDRDTGGVGRAHARAWPSSSCSARCSACWPSSPAQQPVLLILEDMHWADRSTRDLLTFLSRVLHRERVVVIATYRTDDLHRSHPLRPVVGELLRLPSVTAVELGPLPDAAMAEHLTALAMRRAERGVAGRDDHAGPRATPTTPRSCWPRRCGTAASCPPGWPSCCWPGSSGCPPAAQQVLRAAAVTGRRMDDELVRQASGLVRATTRRRSARPSRQPAAGARRGAGLRVPARAAPRGHLRRPAARRADPAARPAGRAAGRRGAGWPRCRALPPSSPTTAWPATTSRARSPPRSGPARRRSGWPRPPRRTGISTRRWPYGSGSASRRSWPGCPAAGWRSSSAEQRPRSGDVARAVSQLRRLLGYLGPGRRPALAAGSASGWPIYLLDIDEATEADETAPPRSACCPRTRPGGSGPGRWRPTRRRLMSLR